MKYFSGETISHDRDTARLAAQYDQVFGLMCDGQWRTLQQISDATGAPPASVSARLRDMRKRRFGAHLVQREHINRGLWRYRVVANTWQDLLE